MFDVPPAPVKILAELHSPRSRCAVIQIETDSERGDPVLLRCGHSLTLLGRGLKGVETDRISACAVVLTIEAVHVPRLIGVDACRGKARIEEAGTSWIERTRRRLGIAYSRIFYVSYARRGSRCYDMTLTYAERPRGDSPFLARTGRFCIGGP